MAVPDDMAGSLPEPPPPAPARREAAIEAALRRFDGVEPVALPSRTRPGFWTRMTRPQAGALITIGIVAVFGVPIAWLSLNQWPDTRTPPPSQGSAQRAVDADTQTPALAQPVPAEQAAKPEAPVQAPAAADDELKEGASAPPVVPPERQAFARADAAPPPAVMTPAAPPPPAAARDTDVVVTAKRRAEQVQNAPMSVTVVGEEARGLADARKAENESDEMVVSGVTGVRKQSAQAPPPIVASPPAQRPRLISNAVVRPRGNLTGLFSQDDYPASARANREAGAVTVNLIVGPAGRAVDCRIERSSGSPALDQATCRILRSRARFDPATDRSGTAVVSSYRQEIVWKLPR